MCQQLPVCIVQTSLRLPPRICRQPSRACLYRKEKTFKTYAIVRVEVNVSVMVKVIVIVIVIVRVKVIVKVKYPQRFLRFLLADGT